MGLTNLKLLRYGWLAIVLASFGSSYSNLQTFTTSNSPLRVYAETAPRAGVCVAVNPRAQNDSDHKYSGLIDGLPARVLLAGTPGCEWNLPHHVAGIYDVECANRPLNRGPPARAAA